MPFFCCGSRRGKPQKVSENRVGTIVDEESDMYELDLSRSGLSEIPDSVFLFERTLEKLFVNSNRIADLPWSVFNCCNLKELNLNDNSISVLPDAVSLLTSLERLDIARNFITDLTSSLKDCKNLKVLDLSMNPFDILPDVVTQISSLEELYINDQYLTFLPANIGRLRRLRVLEVRGNKLRFLPSSFSKLFNLIKLDIGQNEIDKMPPVFQNLRQLQECWYDNNDVRYMFFLGWLIGLKIFELESNSLTTVPKEIGCCKNLIHLSLAYNEIKMLPNEIGDLKSLTILKLNDNCLEELPATIGHLKSLEELDLNENELKTIPSSIGLLRKLVVLHADCNRLRSLPSEIGSCISLRVLSLQDNRLREIPAEVGNLLNLNVLSLTRNRLTYLPISFFKLENLKSLWLSYNQGKPITNLCRLYDSDTHSYVATCYLLPQRMSGLSEDDYVPVEEPPKPRTACRIKFSAESEDKRGGLSRVPTPVPKKMKELSRFGKSGNLLEAGDATNLSQDVVDVTPSDRPSTSGLVKTAFVRKQTGDGGIKCVAQHPSDASCSNTDSDSVEEEIIKLSSNHSDPSFVEPNCGSSPNLVKDSSVLTLISDEEPELNSDLLKDIELNEEDSDSEKGFENVASDTACSTVLADNGNPDVMKSAQVCAIKKSWVFGKHRNVKVVPVTVEKTEYGIGFKIVKNEKGDLIVEEVDEMLECNPGLKVGDKILQIHHYDLATIDLKTIETIFDVESVGALFPMVISRLQ